MEPKDVLVSVGVGLVSIIAILTWLSYLNAGYGLSIGSSFNNTLNTVQNNFMGNLSGISIDVANNTQIGSGAGETDQTQALNKQSVSTFRKITSVFEIIPNAMRDFASLVGIPESYQSIAGWLFVMVFGITLAYVILLGVRRLL